MSSQRLSVVVTRRLPEPVEARMQELFDVTLREDDMPMDRAALAAAMAEADVLVPTVSDEIDAELIHGSGARVKLIANYGSGYDHIDVEAARQQGIHVSNTPGVSADDTADMTMALMMAVTRRIPEGIDRVRSGSFEGFTPTAMLGMRAHGKRLGILGMGRVGQAVARRARAFGMEIHYHNRRRLRSETEAAHGATYWESLDQMVARMDVLSISCPHTPATFHLLNARRLKLMKDGAFVVNTSRGEVIDEVALARELSRLGGAGLDVFQTEPLKDLPNVVLLPHMASATEEGRLEMGEKVLLNIKTHEDGHRPPDLVLPNMD